MSYIKVEKGEPIDKALRRFKKKCTEDGIFEEVKKRVHFRTPRELAVVKREYRRIFNREK